jgi:hypothetical protein
MDGLQTSIEDIVNIVFVSKPSDVCSYNLMTSIGQTDAITMFPILMQIMVMGAKKLFGEDVTPQNMTRQQFATLKRYMLCIGFQVKDSYRYDESTGEPVAINIWFEKVIPMTPCRTKYIL